MKRVKAACIQQTLVFLQKDCSGLSREQILRTNRMDVERYKKNMERTGTRFQIVSDEELEDGSIQIRVRKQYNGKADVTEYFV